MTGFYNICCDILVTVLCCLCSAYSGSSFVYSRACLKIAFRKMSFQFASDFMLDFESVVGCID